MRIFVQDQASGPEGLRPEGACECRNCIFKRNQGLHGNLLIFKRLIPVLSLRTLATSSRGLKKDYPWSDYLEKLPDPSH